MRIAYLTGEYPRATDTFVQREVLALRELGAEVSTFAVRRPAAKELVGPEQQAEHAHTFYILPAGVDVILRSHFSLLSASPKRYFRALRLAWATRPAGLKALVYQVFYFVEAGILAERIRRRKIAHLHNHFANSSCSVSMLAAEMGGFTFSFTMHGPAIFYEPHYWRIDEKIKRALFVSCISHFCRSQAMVFSPPGKWNRLHIVHCGVNPELYEQATHHGRGRRLLFVGRLAAVKGLPVLLQALATLRAKFTDIELTVIGDGPDRRELEQTTAKLGLTEHVQFVGYQSQSAVRRQLEKADVFVMASFAEGVPVVLMEAMAAGVPVVATRVAGVGELVEDGVSGYTVPPGDATALAQKIEALLVDGSVRARFGAAGRAMVQAQFDIRKEASWLHRIMSEALLGRAETLRPISKTGPGDDDRTAHGDAPVAELAQ